MTKQHDIVKVEVTIAEIYNSYIQYNNEMMWDCRNDDVLLTDLTKDIGKDIFGILKNSREILRRMFADGYTNILLPEEMFKMVDFAYNTEKQFTVNIYNDQSKLILVLTTDEVKW